MCVEGRVWKGKEKGVLDSQRQEKESFFCQEEVILECFNTLSPLFTFLPTSKHVAERDASLSNLIHLNHKSLCGSIVLKAKKGPGGDLHRPLGLWLLTDANQRRFHAEKMV